MTRSIFDPTGGNVEHSGSPFTPPDADDISPLPELVANPRSSEMTGMIDFQPPQTPSIKMTIEGDGKLLVFHITGKLHGADYQHFVPVVEQAVQRYGKVRLLIQLHDFHGWDAGALWQDVKFDAKHFNHIERLAIVGEERWEKWMAAFCKPFTTATIRYFSLDQLSDARTWVAAP